MIFATFGIIVGIIILWRTYAGRKNADLFKSIPGPKGYPLIGNGLEFILSPRNKRLDISVKYFNKYGPAYLLYMASELVIHASSVEWVQFLLTSNTEIKKGFFYKFIEPWLFTGLLTSSGEKWHQRRKMLTPAFHFSILNFVSNVIRRNSLILVDNLEAEVNSDGFDVVPYVSSCSLDIICEAAMSVNIDSQRGSSKDYLNNVHLMTQMIADRINNGFLYPDFIHRFSKNYRDQKKSLNVLHGTSMKVIQQRIADRQNQKGDKSADMQNEKTKSFIDLLLDISDQFPEYLSISDILEEVSTFMFEGHDTVSTSLAWTLFLVGNFPEVQKNIFDELDEIFGNSKRLPDKNDMSEMKYLECVFKESLRLYPAVPFVSRRLINDEKMGDCIIPAGVDVAIHIHHLHRSPEHFKNPNKFDPSHFFPEEAQNRHPFAYIPFSAGPRNCVGQKFAMLEVKIILSQIFRNFEVESLQKVEDMKCLPDLILRPEFGVRIKIIKRKCSN